MATWISFDVSTNKIGYAKLEINHEGVNWKYETIDISGENTTDVQVKKIEKLTKWFEDKAWSIDFEAQIILETSTFKGNPTIERFIGIFMTLCIEMWGCKNINLIQPTSWQSKFSAFDGVKNVKGEKIRRTKIKSMEIATEIIGEQITDDDQADAICMTYANAKGWVKDNSIKHREVSQAMLIKRSIKTKIKTAEKRLFKWKVKFAELRKSQKVKTYKQVILKTKADKDIPIKIDKYEKIIKELKEQL